MKILFYVIWAVLLAVLQPTLFQWIAIFGIAPNTFLIFVILAGYLCGSREGAAAGLVFGLLYDLLIGKLMGVNALFFLYIGFGAGILGEKYFGDSKVWIIAGTAAVATILTGVLYWLIVSMVYTSVPFSTGFVKTILPETVYNGIVCVPLYFCVRATRRLVKRRSAY